MVVYQICDLKKKLAKPWVRISFLKKLAKPWVRISLANFHLGPSSYPLSYVVDKPFQFWHTFYAQKKFWPR
jgi:hypothetical protein